MSDIKLFYIFLTALVACLITETEEARIRGKFDRFGKKKVSQVFRNPVAKSYYLNPDGARIIKSSHYELEYELGRKIIFLCNAEGSPKPHITWFKEGIELFAHRNSMVYEWSKDDKSIKSKLEIDPATQSDRGLYSCVADNKWAYDMRRFRTDYLEI